MKLDNKTTGVMANFFILEFFVVLISTMFLESVVTYMLLLAFGLSTISIVFRISRAQKKASRKT